MPLFGGDKKDAFLGVDIGTSGIKIVEVGMQKGRPTLLTYGYTETRPGDGRVSPFEQSKETGATLLQLWKESGAHSQKAMSALPMPNVFSAIVAVPKGKNEKDMKPLIDAQVAKLAPMPLQDMVTYSTFVDPIDKDGEKKDKKQKEKAPKRSKDKDYVRVLVTGAAKTQVQTFLQIFKQAKLELTSLDTEVFAMIRSLVGKDPSSILIVDIGATRTDITAVEQGVPFLTRSITLGGDLVTKRLMEQMKIGQMEAERMKKDLSASLHHTAAAAEPPPAIAAIVQPLLHEIRYTLQLYANLEHTEQNQVQKVLLTGGSSLLPHLADHLANALNMNVYLGDPWARLAYPEDLRPVLDEIGPKLSVAIGLALRDMKE